MTAQNQPLEPVQGGRKPPKRTGWLKVTLATGGVALTVLGTGMIAQREARQTSSAAPAATRPLVDVDLQPIPTLVPLDGLSSSESAQQGSLQLQAPSLSAQQQFRMRSFAQSRSSR